ncbi:MAG: single-stranded DNA-binding protein [Pyrinomonadaceae bacterium]
MSFNKITIVGNLGRDPELRYTPQGKAVCSFSMATNEKKRDKSGELQDVTTWFRVTLWGNQAENANKYLAKGNQVYIEGRLRLEEYTDRDNNTRQTLEVNGSEMHFLGGNRVDGSDYNSGHQEDNFDTHSGPPPAATSSSASSSAAGASGDGGTSTAPTPTPANDDDIPF